jgi:DNA-binding NarL/FixJ family response regulator
VNRQTRVFLADEQPLFRDGLRSALNSAAGLQVIGEAGDGEKALDLIASLRPDVAIMEVSLPALDGVTVTRRLRERQMHTEVIFLTVRDGEDMFEQALDLGVKGYLLKNCTASELVRCVEAVAMGQHYTTPSMTTYIVGKTQRIERFVQRTPGLGLLTSQERTIVRRVAQKKASKEIAEELGLAPKTVDAHRSNICRKLALRGTHALGRFATRHRSEL